MSVEQTNFKPNESNNGSTTDVASIESSALLSAEASQIIASDVAKIAVNNADPNQEVVAIVNPEDYLATHLNTPDVMYLCDDKPFDLPPEWDDLFTKGDAKKAKELLSKENSHLNTNEDNAKITALQEGLIDGDFKKFSKTLKDMKPEERAKFAKELNRQLEEHGAGVKLTEGKDGSLFLHKSDGGTAIQFNKDGSSTLRTMEKNSDGDLNLKPGYLVNQKPEEAIKNIGEAAVNNMTAEKLPDVILIDEPIETHPGTGQYPEVPAEISPRFRPYSITNLTEKPDIELQNKLNVENDSSK